MRVLTVLIAMIWAFPSHSAIYQVGPTRAYPHLQTLFDAVDLAPGDEVQVDGNTTYAGGVIMREDDGGAAGNPVTVRGLAVSGQRPILLGGVNTIEFRLADHVVFQGFEIVGTVMPTRTFRCLYHHNHDLTLRDLKIHACPDHGILSADTDSGSLTIEYSEVFDAGSGTTHHALYLATDEIAHPGSTVRLQHNYLHGTNGGNLVKSRAERNEIYYNWLEGAYYHELELIGPDPGGAPDGWSEGLVREDSDVVGNVIMHTSSFGAILRFGGDGTGQSLGRYRFAGNTVVRLGGSDDVPTVFRLFDGIDAVAMHNNVFWREGTSGMRVIREVEADWASGASKITGSNNWLVQGSSFVPMGWNSTAIGVAPGFTDLAGYELHPATTSALLNAANPAPILTADYLIANPLFPPMRHPPARAALAPEAILLRPNDGMLDIGAFERADADAIFMDHFE